MCQNNNAASGFLFPSLRNVASRFFESKNKPTPPPPAQQKPQSSPRRAPAFLQSHAAERESASVLDLELVGLRFLIPDKLAFYSGTPAQISGLQKSLHGTKFRLFSSDLHTHYDAYADDFGPVNLSVVHRFCTCLTKRIGKTDGEVLVYCFDGSFESQANASFLLAAFLVLRCGKSPQQAAEPFTCTTAPFTLRPFRDCTAVPHPYPLALVDCLAGLARAVAHGWYDPDAFDLDTYEALDDPSAGDIHAVSPKFVAFKGPLAAGSRHRHSDEIAFPPADYAPALRRLGVTCVVRLNEQDAYDPAEFARAGIRHVDLYFPDCTAPPDEVVERFLDLSESEPGRLAVHCRAGLGRTGTLIALWMMKHAGFAADEAIGWLRICRPGSVIGPQQQYLKDCERRPWVGNRLGRAPAAGRRGSADQPTPPHLAMGAGPAAAPADDSDAVPENPFLFFPPSPPAAADGGGGGGFDWSPPAAELARQVTTGMSRRGVVKALSAAGGPHLAARHGAPAGTTSPSAAAAAAAAAKEKRFSMPAGAPSPPATGSPKRVSTPIAAAAPSPPARSAAVNVTEGGGGGEGRMPPRAGWSSYPSLPAVAAGGLPPLSRSSSC